MDDFLQRLKRRKLVQWAAAYAAFAFALIQVLDVAAGSYAWPPLVMHLAFGTLMLGFGVVLVLAWYHGERGAQHVTGTELVIVALLLAIGGGLLSGVARGPGASDGAHAAHPPGAIARATAGADIPAKSVAVLPFVSMSAGRNDTLFADGLSEEIINSLTRVPDLHVAARTSSFAFRRSTQTVPQIAARLRVANVLEGSVRRAGNRLRISAQLVRASDGFSLWSATYNRHSDDIIAIQEDVARSIALALQTSTGSKALAAMQRVGTRSVPAYGAYLRALALVRHARNTGDYALLHDASAAFAQAIELDPAFADAYAQQAYILAIHVDPTELQADVSPRATYAQRMEALRGNLDAAVANARGDVDRKKYQAFRALVDLHFTDGLRLARTYSALRPNDPDGLDATVWAALITGDYPLARATAQLIAQRVSPLGSGSTPMQYMLWARDPARAAQMARAALAQLPDNIDIAYQAHRALLSVGAVREASNLMSRVATSDLPEAARTLASIRQACAEGRTADAAALYRPASPGHEFAVSVQWQELLLLGRTAEAERLLDQFDTPDKLYALASFLAYPMFDAQLYPRLDAVLKAQGIERLPPQAEPYACHADDDVANTTTPYRDPVLH